MGEAGSAIEHWKLVSVRSVRAVRGAVAYYVKLFSRMRANEIREKIRLHNAREFEKLEASITGTIKSVEQNIENNYLDREFTGLMVPVDIFP